MWAEAQTNDLHLRADIESPVRLTNADVPAIEQNNNRNNNPSWLIAYKELFQGNIFHDEHENEAPFFTLRWALMNAFQTIIRSINYINADCIYVFDSHARNNNKLHDIYLI